MEQLTAQQAAERLGVTARRVQAMVRDGRLPAQRFGRALVIWDADLALVADRKAGRPPKAKLEATNSTTTPATTPKRAVKATVKKGDK